MLDHATGIVIGETAVIGDNCSMLHGVTLGGTGNERGDRHPKIGCGVMIGAGAKILGNIKVGDCVRVAAGSVVLQGRAATAHRRRRAGARYRLAGCEEPALTMDQARGRRTVRADIRAFGPADSKEARGDTRRNRQA